MSTILGLVDFAVALVDYFLCLTNGLMKFFWKIFWLIQITEELTEMKLLY